MTMTMFASALRLLQYKGLHSAQVKTGRKTTSSCEPWPRCRIVYIGDNDVDDHVASSASFHVQQQWDVDKIIFEIFEIK